LTGLNELSRLLACESIRVARLGDGSGVVLDQKGSEVFAVNASGMCLLDALRNGIVDPAELSDRLMEEFHVDRSTAEKDVESFVREAVGDLLQRGTG
jgi:hypothetical protein